MGLIVFQAKACSESLFFSSDCCYESLLFVHLFVLFVLNVNFYLDIVLITQLVSSLRIDPEFSLLYFNPDAKVKLIYVGTCYFT